MFFETASHAEERGTDQGRLDFSHYAKQRLYVLPYLKFHWRFMSTDKAWGNHRSYTKKIV